MALDWTAAAASTGQGIMGIIAQERANRANMKLAQYKFKKDQEMWHLQNQYNDPAAQMKRLEAAGLSPHLVYGGGNVTGNLTSGPPEYQAPRIAPIEVPDVLGSYMSARSATVSQELVNQQVANTQAETLSKLAAIPGVKADSRLKKAMAENAAKIAENAVQTGSLTVTKLQNDLVLQGLEQELKKFEIKLNKEGFTKADEVHWRVLVKQLSEMGVSPAQIKQKFDESLVGRLWDKINPFSGKGGQ